MKSNGILFFTDFHAHLFMEFAKHDDTYYTDRFKTQIKLLNSILDKAEKDNLAVVFGGDLFHKRGAVDVRVFNAVWEAFANHSGIPDIHLVRGNHDSYDNSMGSVSSLDTFTNLGKHVHVWSRPGTYRQEVGDTVYDLSFMPYGEDIAQMKDELQELADGAKTRGTKNILIAHLGVDGAKQGQSSHRLASAFTLDDMHADTFDDVYLGHFHARQVLQYKDTNTATGSNGRSISKNTVDAIKYSIDNGLVSYDYDKGIVYYGEPKYVGSPDAQGYYAGHIKTSNGKDFKVRNHLVIGYLKFGYNMVGNTIDHVNNKHGLNDNYPENLEVLSHYENNIKNKDTIDCKALNVNTNKVVYAHSEGDLARKISSTCGAVHGALTKQDSHKTGDYLVQYVGYGFDRAYLNHRHGEVVVDRKDLKTGKIKTYATVSSATSDNHIASSNTKRNLTQDSWYEAIPGFSFKRHTPENKPMPNDRFPMEHHVWYGGSTMQLSFNDEGQDKGYDILHADGSWEFVSSNTPKFVTVTSAEQLKEVSNTDYVRVRLPESQAKKLPAMLSPIEMANVRVEAQIEQNTESRLDINADDNPQAVVTKFMEEYYPDTKQLALDVLKEAIDG